MRCSSRLSTIGYVKSFSAATADLWQLDSHRLELSCFKRLFVMASEDEERLVRDLFRDYNKLIRPVEVMNKTVEVQFGLSFIQLINVNEKNQIMTSNVWLQLNSDTCRHLREGTKGTTVGSTLTSGHVRSPLMMDEGRRSGAENTLMRAPTNQVRETTTGNTQMTYAQRKKEDKKYRLILNK
ncbi:acetylcholine receptor subunit beta-like 1 [Caerostris darwini]|uniref:Acetylcholine receptor subunit beta-like 1 n=1 Tax=Caerostris darwini TaxID=1538125 RepID=A0AAV4PWL2_9ARAC|nr:acetylcholine receptor subunit beta-like 1 [Caerostris darwini]